MGAVTNVVQNIGTGATRAGTGFQKSVHSNFTRSMATNLGRSSKTCPIVSEFRNTVEGIAKGDY